jgi:tol-pal system protein YbgF
LLAGRRQGYDFVAVTTTRWIWVLVASAGCATPMSALREDNRRLTQTVAELRADRRAQDRKLRDLEHELVIAREKAETDGAVPQLPVEVVAPPPATALPESGRVVGVSDDGSEIVYEGEAATGRVVTSADVGSTGTTAPAPRRAHAPPAATASLDDAPTTADRLEVTHRAPIAARSPHPHVRADASGDPSSEYRGAVDLVKAGKYPEAVTALRAFVQRYPRHEYADNAQYWIGEAFYGQRDYPHALAEFRATIELYPRGNKVPDALLKVGYCYAALHQSDKARAVLEQVVSLYPKSEPAALASRKLEETK